MRLALCLLGSIVLALLPAAADDLLWPLGSGFVQYRLRATYGQLEGKDQSVDLHYGLDVIAKKASEPVYALESGTVAKVVTDQGFYNGIVIESGSQAFLYLHLEEDTIEPEEGDSVTVDDYLGDVVYEDDVTGVRHLHLSRLGEWDHAWDGLDRWSVRNPLKMLDPTLLGDDADPVFEKPDGTEWFAVRPNEDPTTTAKPVYQDLDDLTAGELDVLALVHDLDGSSPARRLAPYRIKLTVDPGTGDEQVFELVLDGSLRAYENKVKAFYNRDDVYRSSGEKFFFVPTNAGKVVGPENAWSAKKGTHTLRVDAYDVKGRKESHDRAVKVK